MLLIQALLTGTSPQQCLSRAEKVCREKVARRNKQQKIWDRIGNSPNPREAWKRTDFSDKKKKATKKGENVVAGPWDTAG